MRLLLIFLLINGHNASAQGWFDDYLPITDSNHINYETNTIDDTIWVSKDDTLALRPRRRDYKFKFVVTKGNNIQFQYSRRIRGGDPDFNCNYPKKSLSIGDSGAVTICFPGRIFKPPYVHSRRYLANSNTNSRDTLTINRHFLWSDRDTIQTRVTLGDSTVIVVEHAVHTSPNIIYLNIHENETTSIDALKRVAETLPINYYYLEHSGQRRVGFRHKKEEYSIDPNRIYTDTGRVATLKDGGQLDEFGLKTSKKLAWHILQKIRNGKAVVSVHNNTPDEYSILSYGPDGGEADNTGKLFINDAADPDDFIYTTDSLVFKAAKRDCINVILQSEKTFVDDGSLSVYCGIENILYVNVETEHGHLEEQIRLIHWANDIVNEIIDPR